jgi:hypothetical protein
MDVSPAQWAEAARRRGRKRFVDALGKSHRVRQRVGESEELMARAAEDYRRALLSGADLPPLSTVQVTVETIPFGDPDEPPPF